MSKKSKSPLGIFTESVGLYFSNFQSFLKYMSFPVIGQIIGLCIVFFCTYLYSQKLPDLIEKHSFFNDFNNLVLISVLVALPGLIIFTKAFWEYLVAYGAVNSMLDNMLKSGRVYDFNAHIELIKRRSSGFVVVWLLLGIFSLIGIFPLLWVPAAIAAVYLSLIFQVFTYDSELSPIGCFKKSFNLIKGHFATTFLLLILSGMLTWVFIPGIFNHMFEFLGINKIFVNMVMPFMHIFNIENLNASYLSQLNLPLIKEEDIANLIISTTITQIIIQYTLPLRSIVFAMWYKELNGFSEVNYSAKKKKSSSKRPSEKLMENSHNQYIKKKKFDRNILKRAMQKDDEE